MSPIMASSRGALNKVIKKRTRNQISLEIKLKIIQMLEKGEKTVNVARLYNLNESTIRTIKRSADAIKTAAKEATPESSRIVKHTRNIVMVKMEKLLIQWIEENNKKNIHMDTRIIQNKALSIFNQLKKRNEEDDEEKSLSFVASKGWFDKFRKRYNLHNFKLVGETVSANEDAATKFVKFFKIFIENNGYNSQQVFNADETGLYWKSIPKRTFISKEEKEVLGFNSAKDRLTLLLCGNASGDYKCKPLLIYHSANPRVLKHVDKSCLPVHWKSNKKSLMTACLFEDWFTNIFCPEVEEYCRLQKIPFKILLVIDIASSHPVNLDQLNPNVKVLFMAPNTTALIQPMEQGVITNFKKSYLKYAFKQMFDKLEADKQITLREFWPNYNIADAIENIKKGWKDLESTTINAAWRNLWPDCVSNLTDDCSLLETVDNSFAEVVALAQQGFNDLNASDIEELLKAELTTNDFIELNQEENNEEEIQDDNEKETPNLFTNQNIKDSISMIQKAIDFIESIDPDSERSSSISRGLKAQIAPYELILEERKQMSEDQTRDRLLIPSTLKTIKVEDSSSESDFE